MNSNLNPDQFSDALPSGHRENWEPGSRPCFEYHCYEGHDSADAQAWYRSHRQVTVLGRNWADEEANGMRGASFQDRGSEGAPASYEVRHDDGFQHTAMEDELMVSPKHYVRPDPPKPESGRAR